MKDKQKKTPMSEEVYKQRMQQLEAENEKKRVALMLECANSHRKFSIGDIISHNGMMLKVDKIGAGKAFEPVPYPIYSGYELKKDFTVRKDKSRISFHGNKGVELIKSA